jgi:CheY-like chemotaxis protein
MSSARILWAEDDADFRALVSAALRKADYRVVEASDGVDLAEQLNLARLRNRHDRPFDLVISDVRMPGRSGLEGRWSSRGPRPTSP